ncbi:MAG: hypothetical protein GY811_21540 [Myxococcales bacterium]|nr:hypothetical protein [Myxococcales bacterium]
MLPNSISLRFLLAEALLVPGALATGAAAACTQNSADTAGPTNTNAVASSAPTGPEAADTKKVILSVFGMT